MVLDTLADLMRTNGCLVRSVTFCVDTILEVAVLQGSSKANRRGACRNSSIDEVAAPEFL
jgi:hypothetical protein